MSYEEFNKQRICENWTGAMSEIPKSNGLIDGWLLVAAVCGLLFQAFVFHFLGVKQ